MLPSRSVTVTPLEAAMNAPAPRFDRTGSANWNGTR